jgi:quercetin dioxygenase-like cupin family protein
MKIENIFRLRVHVGWVFAAIVVTGLAMVVHRSTAATPKAPRPAYTVKFENEKVRALEYVSEPKGDACGFGKHSHPDHLTILLTDAKVRVTGADGKVTVEDGKAGDMFWEPAATHMVEDVSGNAARYYVIEMKDKDWKPSTGLTK